MQIFCNYLEAHIMTYNIKLIQVFLSCYKRILLSHQIIVSSRTHATSHLLFSSLPTSLLHTLPAIPHKEVYKNRIKVGVEGEEENTGDEKGFRS